MAFFGIISNGESCYISFNGYPEAAWAKRKKGGLTRKRSSKQSTKRERLQQYILTHKLLNLQRNPQKPTPEAAPLAPDALNSPPEAPHAEASPPREPPKDPPLL